VPRPKTLIQDYNAPRGTFFLPRRSCFGTLTTPPGARVDCGRAVHLTTVPRSVTHRQAGYARAWLPP